MVGLGDSIGSLARGRLADLILVDLTGPHTQRIQNLAATLVHSTVPCPDDFSPGVGKAHDVDDGSELVGQRLGHKADAEALGSPVNAPSSQIWTVSRTSSP